MCERSLLKKEEWICHWFSESCFEFFTPYLLLYISLRLLKETVRHLIAIFRMDVDSSLGRSETDFVDKLFSLQFIFCWYDYKMELSCMCLFLFLFFFFFLVESMRLFFLFWEEKKGTRVWQLLSHAPRYSWISPWIPLVRTGAPKLRTHTHPRFYWFLGLSKIAITVFVRTRTWDVVKPQQSPTSCITPAGGVCAFF